MGVERKDRKECTPEPTSQETKEPPKTSKTASIWKIPPWRLADVLKLEKGSVIVEKGFVTRIELPGGELIKYPKEWREHLEMHFTDIGSVDLEGLALRKTKDGVDFACSDNFSSEQRCIYGTILTGGELNLLKISSDTEEIPTDFLELASISREEMVGNFNNGYDNRVRWPGKRSQDPVPLRQF